MAEIAENRMDMQTQCNSIDKEVELEEAKIRAMSVRDLRTRIDDLVEDKTVRAKIKQHKTEGARLHGHSA